LYLKDTFLKYLAQHCSFRVDANVLDITYIYHRQMVYSKLIKIGLF